MRNILARAAGYNKFVCLDDDFLHRGAEIDFTGLNTRAADAGNGGEQRFKVGIHIGRSNVKFLQQASSQTVGLPDQGEQEMFRFFDSRKPGILGALAEKKQMDDALKADMSAALKEFGEQFAARQKGAAA